MHPDSSLARGPALAALRAPLDLAGIPEAALLVDAHDTIDAMNALAEALLGHGAETLVGAQITKVLPDLFAAATANGGTRFLPGSAGRHVQHRNGTTIPVEVMICPHERGSALVIVRSLSRSSRGLSDEDVVQIIHDFKGPLSTIALEAELLDYSEAPRPSGAARRIMLNVAFLDRMIHDLLDLSALDSGRFTLYRAPTELRDLLEQVLERVVSTRDRERVHLLCSRRITLDLDGHRIERVVANLLQNALKYAPPDSTIVVRLDCFSDHVSISVADVGPGIPPNEQGTVFDKYRRVAATRGREGSGLGLHVSKGIVEAHGGRIGVDSIHGEGSRFFFDLPVR